MKVTIFTSNSLRHKNLINSISRICSDCYAIIESKTLFPGKVDDFFKKSKLNHKYFNEVEKSEKFFFKNNNFIKKNVKTIIIKQGDLNLLKKNDLKEANSDVVESLINKISEWKNGLPEKPDPKLFSNERSEAR